MLRSNEYENDDGNRDYDLSDPQCCIVGTCHLFNDNYFHGDEPEYCPECTSYSEDFGDLGDAFDDHELEKEYQVQLEKFAKHFLKCHSKIPKPLKNRPSLKDYDKKQKEITAE